MDSELAYNFLVPDAALKSFVESFWMLNNNSRNEREIMLLPDGRIDVIFTTTKGRNSQPTLLGISTRPEPTILPAQTCLFAVSFKLPAAEYIFKRSVADILNSGENLIADLWNVDATALRDLLSFSERISKELIDLLPEKIDSKKQQLFDLAYDANGEITVKELSEKIFWPARQMNRYFHAQFGISLKAWCNILRFRASFGHIKEGKLFPEQNFADQSHFIREVKKHAGALPKELSRNKNDRFIQFSTLPEK